VEFLHR
jgi:serine/threonine protein kinase